MERPQNQQGSCLATWEGPGDGLCRLEALKIIIIIIILGLNFLFLKNNSYPVYSQI
jgi:hypothetical protein